MRYLGLSVGHLNPPSFPQEDKLLCSDVLIENDDQPWDHGDDAEMHSPHSSDEHKGSRGEDEEDENKSLPSDEEEDLISDGSGPGGEL